MAMKTIFLNRVPKKSPYMKINPETGQHSLYGKAADIIVT